MTGNALYTVRMSITIHNKAFERKRMHKTSTMSRGTEEPQNVCVTYTGGR